MTEHFGFVGSRVRLPWGDAGHRVGGAATAGCAAVRGGAARRRHGAAGSGLAARIVGTYVANVDVVEALRAGYSFRPCMCGSPRFRQRPRCSRRMKHWCVPIRFPVHRDRP